MAQFIVEHLDETGRLYSQTVVWAHNLIEACSKFRDMHRELVLDSDFIRASEPLQH